MKKIGILTFHRSINYGAYMQCFSLAHYLEKKLPHCKVEVIDYESRIMHEHYLPRLNLSMLRHPLLFRENKRQYKSFQGVLKYLPLSEKYFVFDGQNEEFSRYVTDNYDVVIVGSDAVFNYLKRGFPNPYVCPPGKKKLSYAASAYGMAREKTKEADREVFGKALEKFSFLGVRDSYTQELVQSLCTAPKPEFTCDPTILLEPTDVLKALGHTRQSYQEYIYQKYNLPRDKKLVGVMETDHRAMEELRATLGEEYCFVGVYCHTKGVDRYISDVNPLEWSLIFGLFTFTITNFFHGTLLSLRNHTPVMSFDRTEFSKIHEGKIHDVMRRMDLLDCCYQGTCDLQAVTQQAKHILANREAYSEKIATNLKNLEQSAEKFITALKECL